MDKSLLLNLTSITVFTLMLAIGVNHSLRQVYELWRQPSLLLRSLLGVLVIVPMVVMLLIGVFKLPAVVAAGLAYLAASPGAPLTTKRSQMALADRSYVSSLQLTLALLAVVTVPITLVIFCRSLDLGIKGASPLDVAGQVAKVQFLPLAIGLLLQRFLPQLTDRIGKWLAVLANVLFLLLLVLAIVPGVKMVLKVSGGGSIVAILILALLALATGHLLGGPNRGQRSGLAIACIARNVGMALYLATQGGEGQSVAPPVVAYMVLGAVVAVPYSFWTKRQGATSP